LFAFSWWWVRGPARAAPPPHDPLNRRLDPADDFATRR
jgi:hypothetical protein